MKNQKYFIYIFFIIIILCSCGSDEAEVEHTNSNEDVIEDLIKIYQISEKQSVMLLTIIEKASVASSYDGQLHSIVLEEVQSYFSKDKTLEEDSEVMQGRGMMLIGEAMK